MRRSTPGNHVDVRRRGVRSSRGAVVAAVAALVGGAGLTAVPVVPAEAAVVRPFTLGFDRDVFGDFLEVGNGTMRCPDPTDPTDPSSSTPISSCPSAQTRSNTTVNDNYFMRWADVDADPGTFSSSRAELTIPAGADVAFARLNWAGNTGRFKTSAGAYSTTRGCSTRQATLGVDSPVPSGSPGTTPVQLSVGGAAAVPVTGTVTVDPSTAVPNSSPEYYSAFADVTAAFAGAATGSPLSVGVGDVWAPQGFGCFGGWSLVLVYEYDEPTAQAPLKRSVQVYDGHVRQANGEAPTGVTLTGIRAASSDVRIGVTAYEGDHGIVGDEFQINGTSVLEPSTGGSTTNFFVSDADGATAPAVANNFSVDAKQITTSLIPSGSQTASLNFVTTGDSYLAQNVALSVPISALSLSKVPDATLARPGDPIEFTITAENPSPAGLNDVLVSDPAYPQCDRNIGPLAPGTSFTYTCTVPAGSGDLSNTATGTGTDTFGDPVSDTVTAETVDVINPAVDLTKSLAAGETPPYAAGDTVTFALSVTNTGDAPLSDVTVTDPVVPACARTVAALAAGATESWTCTTAAPVPGRTNTASVVATDQLGGTVTDTDDVVVPNASSIGGTVFVDVDGDGALGGDDTGIGGVALTLAGTDESGTAVSRTATTDADGTWSFEDLVTGTYTVTETQPAGYRDSTDTAGSGGTLVGDDAVQVVLADGAASTGTLFAEVAGSLSGSVYADADADGVRDGAETGVGGVAVTLTGTTDAGASMSLGTTTSADGTWSFRGVPGGTYTVTEAQPAGFLDGREGVGTAGGTTSPPDGVSGIDLDPGQDATGYTFGEVLAAGLAGTVADDRGRALEGVTVTLTGTDDLGGAVTVTTTTGAGGVWAFADLRPGTYAVTETQPAGYGAGSAAVGTAGGTAATADQVTTVVLAPGTSGTGYGFVDTTGSLSGAAYVDVDGDGGRDAGEPGLGGVEVVLVGTGGAADGDTVTVTTVAGGGWTAVGLRGGTWSVAGTQPVLWADGDETAGDLGGTPDGDDTVEGVVLPAGGTGTGYLFGELGASLAGTVYTDADGDGSPDAAEPGIGGVTVTVTGTDAAGAALTPRAVTTAADGTWAVPGLPAGSYTVTETQPAGYADGADSAGASGGTLVAPDSVTGVDLAAGEQAGGYLFGERLGIVTGTVFTDSDRDGVLDAGEGGVGGVPVTLLDAGGDAVATTTTGAGGTYEFRDLAPGDYTVVRTGPTGYGSSTPDGVDVAVSGTAGASVDFGLTLGTVGDRVWDDRDRDGTQDGDEPGVGGTTVELVDADGTVVATTTTAADGSYSFAAVAGTYRVRLVLPAGTTVTRPGAGTDGRIDSDVVQATLTSGPVTLSVAGDGAVQDVEDVDAGLVPVLRDLAVTVAAGRGAAAVGDRLAWTVVVTNEGTVPEDGAVVVATLPPGVRLDGTSGAGWTCTAVGRVVTCTTDTVLAPGGQAPPLQLVTTVTADGDLALEVTVQPSDGSTDAEPADDLATAVVRVAADPPPARPAPEAAPAGRLPRTGAEPAAWLGTATCLMAVGAALVVGSRRRRLVAGQVAAQGAGRHD